MEIRLSSFKRGHSLKELLSKDMSEYWATDDILPHAIQISFDRLQYVHSIQLFLSFAQDDSYTPERIEIRTGLTREAIRPVSSVTLVEPEGLFTLNIARKCFYIQLIINSNHQEGKDSHIRHMKVMESPTKEIFYNIQTHSLY
jgi:anaphase-promoting complex subunit 10